jgi:hypothetical protein
MEGMPFRGEDKMDTGSTRYYDPILEAGDLGRLDLQDLPFVDSAQEIATAQSDDHADSDESAFWTAKNAVLERPNARKIAPVESLEDLRGDFWPKDETTEDFLACLHQWRREE